MTITHRGSKIGRSVLLLIGTSMLLVACATGGSTPTATPTRPPAFQRTLKTTDGLFMVQFSVTPNRLGLNVFTVQVHDTSSGKPETSLHVQLTTTMLDMDMGTDQVNLPSNGHGQYSTQGTLSMSGHWEIRILLRTADTSIHQASVELTTSS